MTTLAPEIDGGIELIQPLVEEGWFVSIGHTRAAIDTLDRAYAAGARHMTHFFNAMTGIHHREVGVAGWGQEVYFNNRGQRAAFNAERKTDVVKRIEAQGGPLTEDELIASLTGGTE